MKGFFSVSAEILTRETASKRRCDILVFLCQLGLFLGVVAPGVLNPLHSVIVYNFGLSECNRIILHGD